MASLQLKVHKGKIFFFLSFPSLFLYNNNKKNIWNAPVVSLVLPTFNDTGSLGSPPRQVVYPPG